MKKTQSLKLMLLGLMASVSTSAFAAVGDVFASGSDEGGYLFYEQITAKEAKLVGVQTVGQKGNIVIPTTAKNTWDSNPKTNVLNVTAVDNDWFGKTEVIVVHYGADGQVVSNSQASQPSEDLRNYDGLLTLTIDAKWLPTISTKALQPLNQKIKKFVVTPDAGLTAIPDYAFFNGKYSPEQSVQNPDVVAQQERLTNQINILNNRINGLPQGKTSDGAQAYALVTSDSEHKPVLDKNGEQIIVCTTGEADKDGLFALMNVYTGEIISGVKGKANAGTGNLINLDRQKIGNKLTEDVKGLQQKYNDAVDKIGYGNQTIANIEANPAYQSALADVNAAKQALKDAQGMLALYQSNVTYPTTGETKSVGQWWYDVPSAVVTAIAAGSNSSLGNNQTLKDQYAAIWYVMQNAKYTNEDGKIYRYANNGTNGYDRPLSDNLIQAVNEKTTTANNAATSFENTYHMNYWKNTYLANAEAEKAAVEPYLTADKTELQELTAQLESLDPEIPVYLAETDRWGNVVNNTVLKVVNLNGTSLIGIGTSAFQNCPDAGFGPSYGGPESRIPLTTKFIGARAFQNTKIQPQFDNVVDLESIGDYAFAQSGTVNGNFSNATKLKTFGTNVFDDCAIKNLLLKGTPLKAVPGNLAQGLKRVNAKFVDGCGYFYNYDVTNPDDVAALKAKGFDDDYIADFNGGEALVNVSLTEASLPEGIKEIPDDTYANCVKLATLVGGVPAGVESIGAMAFFRTKIMEFNLTNLSKLSFIGEQAFAGNPTLTTVNLPQGKDLAALSLGKEVFECDGSLEEVTLGDNITCLPAGTFAGNNKMKKLDLSKTKIEVLYNLFATGEEIGYPNQYGEMFKKEFVNTQLEELILPDRELASDNWTVVTPGLKAIAPYALAYMQGLTEITIPSTVFYMGDGAFYNCANLETVTAMDSHLKTIGFNTFRNCRHLKDFYFVTVSRVDRHGMNADKLKSIENNCGLLNESGEISREFLQNQDFFNQYNFFADNAEGTPNVWVTKESKEYLEREFGVEGHTYANLKEFDTYLTLPSGDGKMFSDSYVNSEYGIWIPEDQAEVFTVYQDKTDVVMYKAKHVGGYYKIPAATAYKNISDLMPQLDGDDDDDDAIDLDDFNPLFVPVISDYNPSWQTVKVPYVVEFEGGEVIVTRPNGDDVWSDEYSTEIFDTDDHMYIDGQEVDVAGITYYVPDNYGWLFQYNGDWYYCSACSTEEEAKLFAYEEDGYFISEDDSDEYDDDISDYRNNLEKYLENIQENYGEIVSTMGMHFSKFLPGVNGVYNHPFWYGTYLDWYLDGYSTVADKRLYPSAACIIVAKQAKVSYERHSTPDKMWQSTLDPGSQLRAVGKPIKFEDTTTSSNLWMWAYQKTAHDPHDWYPVNKGTIKSGRVVLPLLAGQGMSRLNVVWVNDDAITSVMTPQQYLNSLRDTDAIYNLQGVRVVAPQKGQLYIQNGKKFIQK